MAFSLETPRLYIDTQIRDWVLATITLVMILVGILRHYVVQLLQSPQKKQPRTAVREQRALLRSSLLRTNGSALPPAAFGARKAHLSSAFQKGEYLKDGPPKEGETKAAPNPLTDPGAMDGMMDGMKKQMVMFIPQTVLMGWISFFFSGFILIKLPFPLTRGFKTMLQRGLETADMPASYVSSISWYFLNLFGLNGLFRLILGDDNAADGTRDMQSMAALSGGAANPMAATQDFNKLFLAERDNLEIAEPRWVADGVERRLLAKYGRAGARKKAEAGAGKMEGERRKRVGENRKVR